MKRNYGKGRMMAAEYWSLLRLIAVTGLLGLMMIRTVTTRGQFPLAAVLGLSIPVGMGGITLICLVLGIAGIPLVLNHILGAAAVLVAAGLLREIGRSRNQGRNPGSGQPVISEKPCFVPSGMKGAVLYAVLGAYLVFGFYMIVGLAAVFPMHACDAISVHALKAKVFFYDASIAAIKDLPFKSYPLFIPFELLWSALNLGRWDETLLNMVFPLTYLGFSIFQYAFVRERFGPLWALATVALTSSSALYNYHGVIAYQDFALMVFNVSALMIMVMAYRRKDLGLLALAGLCSGLGVFVKMEGVVYWGINVLMCLYLLRSLREISWPQKLKALAVYLSFGIVIFVGYTGFTLSQGITYGEGRLNLAASAIPLLERLALMANSYFHVLFLANNWTMVWGILIVSVLVFRGTLRKDFEARFFGLMILLSLSVFVTVDVVSANQLFASDSFSRIMLHFYPLVPMLIMCLHAVSPVGEEI